MTPRDHALASMRIAGYHNDQRTRVRLICEHRISRKAFDEAWATGVKQKAGGMRCSCYQCNKTTTTTRAPGQQP